MFVQFEKDLVIIITRFRLKVIVLVTCLCKPKKGDVCCIVLHNSGG